MTVMSVSKFERFFRVTAGLDVDKNDLKRFNDFVTDKLYDLLIRAQAVAKANHRDIMQPWDLPITKGLQERIHEFGQVDEDIELQPVLEQLAVLPPLGADYSDETRSRLPEVVGGIGVGLARTFKIIDPKVKNPQTEHWNRAIEVFGLLL